MGLEALVRGWVSRVQPQPLPDNDRGVLRLGRYGESYVVPLVRKNHALAEEGSYFTTNNAQTGISLGTPVAFVATTPICVISNLDSPSNPSAKRINLDYLNFQITAAGGAASTLASVPFAIVVDATNRFSSGGTSLTSAVTNPNMDSSVRSSIANVVFGAITATAATGSARTIVGQRFLRPFISATVATVIGDDITLTFGGVESPGTMSIVIANMVKQNHSIAPVMIGPGQSALVYVWLTGATTPAAISALPELGWWER